MTKLLSIIGLSKKAGKLTYGFDKIASAVKFNEIDRVFIANDLSEKTLKNLKFLCEKNDILIIECDFTMNEIDFMINKRTGIIAILDKGLANKAQTLALQSKQTNKNE